MSTDSGWSDYLSTETTAMDATAGAVGFETPVVPAVEPVLPELDAAAVAEPVLPEPVLDAVETDLTRAAGAQDWSDWHAASGDSWAGSAQDYLDYAQENAAQGYFEIAENAMATAADHAAIADANYDVASGYDTTAGSFLDAAVAEVAPYDAGTSFDVAE